MNTSMRVRLLVMVCSLGSFTPAVADDAFARMKFNDVKEVAPGVFFRYSAISPTDMSIFGGSNNIWIAFKDYVVVIDATFPKEAHDVIAAIRKTTDKPIRYVLDTHWHGDHAYGNCIFAKEGASIVAQTNCAKQLRLEGPAEFKKAGEGPTGRKDIKANTFKDANVAFDDKLVLDDGTQRVEFLFFGHAHTTGDAFAYLPQHKILCTGDACVNGAYNFMGHGDSASWIRVLERCQQLDVRLICPGHGPVASKELLETQKRYFVELRNYVQKGINAGQEVDDLVKNIDFPWYKEWTGVKPSGDNVKQVYGELTGRVAPWDLVEEFGVLEGTSPTKDSDGWTAPRRIIVPNLMPARLNELKRLAPDIEFIPVKTAADAVKAAEDADAVLGFCSTDLVKAGSKLRWIQVNHAGVEKELSPELISSKIVLTNTQRLTGAPVADQAMALLLSLTRRLNHSPAGRSDGRQELHGKTMLVVGLGGVGTQVARRAHGFGMRVMAIDAKDMVRPDFVFSLAKPERLNDLLPQADVVILACPLTEETRGMMAQSQFQAMKKTAYFINVARGGCVQTAALVEALQSQHLAGAGLDVTDPEPMPEGHPLTKMNNVVLSPHVAAQSPEGQDRQWRLWRENVRRFVAGEKLLCVVDKAKGY
jgi:phosphoglycerate dehydrogenase-like enzyme/glyoxylase-like metal-dependent hydrolase (beta-lactamase superfamily II)